jgi:hypothetical protein
MMIFKNNFDFDLWETHLTANVWHYWLEGWPYYSYQGDANCCGNSYMTQNTGGYFAPAVITNYYQNLEQIYTV